jgi:protein phosphatase 1G
MYEIESNAGCTANVALFIKNELYVANSGDSRSILMSNDIVEEMSIDHKPEDPIERSRVEKAGKVISLIS